MLLRGADHFSGASALLNGAPVAGMLLWVPLFLDPRFSTARTLHIVVLASPNGAEIVLSGAAALSGADRLNIITKKRKEPNNNSGATKSGAADHLRRCQRSYNTTAPSFPALWCANRAKTQNLILT